MERVLRTPDERFAGLPGYPFEPNFIEIDGGPLGALRLHYVDEGPKDGETVLLMHGEPSWSYLYRNMIPVLTEAGCRVVAPDLIGFGRSDKPAKKSDYTYEGHVAWMRQFLAKTDLRDVTLFCQDWGGLIGLRLVAAEPERFARVAASNTALPRGEGMSPAFKRWQRIAKWSPIMPIGKVLQRASTRELSDAEVAAYEAPFPSQKHKAGARIFPALVPVEHDDPSAAENRVAWAALGRFERPFLTLFGDSDPVTRGADERMQAHIPGAKGQPHRTIAGGHHFIQEDAPKELANAIIDLIERTPTDALRAAS